MTSDLYGFGLGTFASQHFETRLVYQKTWTSNLGGGNSIFVWNFHPENWGSHEPQFWLAHIFQMGLVQNHQAVIQPGNGWRGFFLSVYRYRLASRTGSKVDFWPNSVESSRIEFVYIRCLRFKWYRCWFRNALKLTSWGLVKYPMYILKVSAPCQVVGNGISDPSTSYARFFMAKLLSSSIQFPGMIRKLVKL